MLAILVGKARELKHPVQSRPVKAGEAALGCLVPCRGGFIRALQALTITQCIFSPASRAGPVTLEEIRQP